MGIKKFCLIAGVGVVASLIAVIVGDTVIKLVRNITETSE